MVENHTPTFLRERQAEPGQILVRERAKEEIGFQA